MTHTEVVEEGDQNSDAPSGANEEIVCTAMESDWGDEPPNLLMHPPCQCPRCAPPEVEQETAGWLRTGGGQQPVRVEPAILGESGRESLG